MSIPQILQERQANPNFVAKMTDYDLGKRMFYQAIPYHLCLSDEMRNGWNAAEGRVAGAIYAQGGYAASDAVFAATGAQ